MVDIYVSKLGDDGTGDGSQLNPYLTWLHALSVATDGDEIEGSDGVYDETLYLQVADDNLTLNSENRHGAIIRNAGALDRVVNITNTGDNLTFGEVVLDAANTHAAVIQTGSTANALTLSGTKLLNPTGRFATFTGLQTFTMDSDWVCEGGTMSQDALRFTANPADANMTIQDGTMTVSDIASGEFGIFLDPSNTGMTTLISGVTVDLATDSAAHATTGIASTGSKSVIVRDSEIIIRTSQIPNGINLANDPLEVMTTCLVFDNTVTADSAAGGIGIAVGTDADADVDENSIDNARVFDNIVSYFNHGILLGNITAGRACGNKLSNNVLGVLFKSDNDCIGSGNVVIDCTGSGALRFKGSDSSILANNLVYYSTGFDQALASAQYADSASALVTTGAKFVNNSIYSDGRINRWAIVDVGSDVEFDANNYYLGANGTANSSPWRYTGTSYGSIALWMSSVGTVAVNQDETDNDPEIDLSTYISEGLKTTGHYWWGTGPRPTGYGGEPFSTIDLDVGSTQSTTGPFHPVNL